MLSDGLASDLAELSHLVYSDIQLPSCFGPSTPLTADLLALAPKLGTKSRPIACGDDTFTREFRGYVIYSSS